MPAPALHPGKQPPRRWRVTRRGLVTAVGVLLALALLAVVVGQAQQYRLLRQAFESEAELGAVSAFEAETTFQALRSAWQGAQRGEPDVDAALLQGHYAAWTRQLDRLGAEHAARRPPDAEQAAFLAQAEAWRAAADRALGSTPEAEVTPAFLAALGPALEAQHAPLLQAGKQARQRMLAQLAQRDQLLRAQNRLGLGVSASLALLTLGFAALALLQLRRLGERRRSKEALALQLQETRQGAEAARHAQGSLLAEMGHELRAPVEHIAGVVAQLRASSPSPRQVDQLRQITESADRLLAVLDGTLDAAQLEAGCIRLAPSTVDLRGLLREVEALLRPRALAKGLALHVDADAAAPERVQLDATRVRQVLVNLLWNAVNSCDRGAVVLEVHATTDGPGRPQLAFVVTDTGSGMDAAALDRLFSRPGSSAAPVTPQATPGRGRGLGLQVARGLARLMGGDITVRSRPGQGSCFSFQMPLAALAADVMATPAAPNAAAATPRPLRVLVAEDHPVNREYMAALFERLGHDVHFTQNGQEAVDAVRAVQAVQALQAPTAPRGRPFDLVLMDLHMPVMDGLAATRALRALPDAAASTVPIVALTADRFDDTRERCLLAGMNDYLAKPVSPPQLAALLRRLFGAAAASESLTAAGLAASATGAAAAALPDTSAAAVTGTQAARAPARVEAPGLIDELAIQQSLQAMSPERLAEIIDNFLDQAPELLQGLRAAVRGAQSQTLSVHAHAAKGAASNLGLVGLAATAQALHDGAACLPAHEIARLVLRFEEQLPLTRAAVAALGLRRASADAMRAAPTPSQTPTPLPSITG